MVHDVIGVKAWRGSGENYLDVSQNSAEWMDLRKFKITSSCLPALFGMYGSKEIDTYWDV